MRDGKDSRVDKSATSILLVDNSDNSAEISVSE
jgi:hypothetical protein